MAGAAIVAAAAAAMIYAAPLYDKTPYHTSALSGEDWVRELINGHPGRIRCELGVHKHIFQALISYLENIGHTHSRYVTLEEQLSIFLYKCVTGLSVRHVGERFQRSNDTISRYVFLAHHQIAADRLILNDSHSYFTLMLEIFSSPPFYTDYVSLPAADDPIAPYIRGNTKFFPFFKDAVGAIDGTHFACSPTAAERAAARDYKGGVTQNCLAACNFNLEFIYIFSGWEGSATDSAMFNDARLTDLHILPGKYYLADAGFPSSLGTIIPYRGIRYHLAEWGRAGLRYVVLLSISYQI
jgi:hypothetical protein